MDFQLNNDYNLFVSELPDDQPPATSYPDPQKPGQMEPMNPTPEIPGTDAPEVQTGTNIEPSSAEKEESSAEEE